VADPRSHRLSGSVAARLSGGVAKVDAKSTKNPRGTVRRVQVAPSSPEYNKTEGDLKPQVSASVSHTELPEAATEQIALVGVERSRCVAWTSSEPGWFTCPIKRP
jgi:hypothetical protein